MNGSLNTHNIWMYAAQGQRPLDFAHEKKDRRLKLTVWIGLIGDGSLIGPFFFRRNINGEHYLDMINDQVVPRIDELARL